MAEDATRVRAGQTVTLTFNGQSATATHTAHAIDAAGRRMDATATRRDGSPTVIDVTIASTEWKDGRPGIGRVILKADSDGAITYPAARQLRILPGIDAYGTEDGYAW